MQIWGKENTKSILKTPKCPPHHLQQSCWSTRRTPLCSWRIQSFQTQKKAWELSEDCASLFQLWTRGFMSNRCVSSHVSPEVSPDVSPVERTERDPLIWWLVLLWLNSKLQTYSWMYFQELVWFTFVTFQFQPLWERAVLKVNAICLFPTTKSTWKTKKVPVQLDSQHKTVRAFGFIKVQ